MPARISVIIPAYNEEASIGEVLKTVRRVPTEPLGYEKEIIVVDDGSADETARIAESFDGVVCVRQANQGKGSAVRRGIAEATGDFVLIQDADLEYDPADYLPMLETLGSAPATGGGPEKIAVYGSRLRGQIEHRGWKFPFPGRHPEQGVGPYIAGAILTFLVFCLYGRWITDTLTAYKLYPAAWLKSLSIKTSGFETDHELSAKLIKNGFIIKEIPISYDPRSEEEGKKIRARDGFIAFWTLLRFRFTN